jgi:Dynein light chain type 1
MAAAEQHLSEQDYRKLISKALVKVRRNRTRFATRCRRTRFGAGCTTLHAMPHVPLAFPLSFLLFPRATRSWSCLLRFETALFVQSIDMSAEMAAESMEIITMAVDKHQTTKNYEAAAQLIKSTMDKKFGAAWHCAIGEGFGFDITYQAKNMVYVYYGQIGILAFKC